MNVLTVFGQPGNRSVCHAIQERFDAGPPAAGRATTTTDASRLGGER